MHARIIRKGAGDQPSDLQPGPRGSGSGSGCRCFGLCPLMLAVGRGIRVLEIGMEFLKVVHHVDLQ